MRVEDCLAEMGGIVPNPDAHSLEMSSFGLAFWTPRPPKATITTR